MAWTLPVTWVDGVAVTAADLNQQLRDNLFYLKGAAGVPYIENALELPEIATPSTPASGRGRIYPDSNGIWRGLDDAGALQQMIPATTLTYTPTYTGASTAGTTTYSIQVGRYRMLSDNLCWFETRIDWTNATGTGLVQISLPLVSRNISNAAQAVAVWISNVTFAGSGLVCVINPNSQIAFIGTLSSNAATATITVETAGTIIIEGVYEVA